VPGISSGHCRAAIRDEIGSVRGVESVEVDLETQRVVVAGDGLDDRAIRAAIYQRATT
jgi:copper chaperone